MAETKRTTAAKRGRAIPVKVRIDSQKTPVQLSPLPAVQLPPTAPKRVQRKTPKPARPPVHDWPEEQRRRLMWWLVIGGAAVVVISWLGLIRYEFSDGANRPNLFNDIGKLIRTIHWPSSPKPTPAQQEISNYEKQVFPQFTK